jgi:hypothetical protein
MFEGKKGNTSESFGLSSHIGYLGKTSEFTEDSSVIQSPGPNA